VSAETAPIVIAKTMISDSEGRVLVLRRSKTDKHRPGGADFPGGSLEDEDGNDPVQTAIREAREEVSIELAPDQIEEVAVMTETREHDGRVFRRYLNVARLSVRAAEVKVELDPEEHGAVHGWEQPAALPELFDGTSWVIGIQKAIQSGQLAT
jgi:8-oxo-dGTP pyrophosphatase MutT (NUDIX family)